MLQENEIVMVLLGLGVMFFVVGYLSKFKSLPEWKILVAGFVIFFLGWIMTILEGTEANDTFNYLEHLCYMAGSILLAVWCWKVFGRGNETA